ncbi:uncharacterized protein A1O9_03490 [Exophiala aquamarina CBS 119918]|uniref:Rad21/Rec8-like protein C-terminal eukaryotic domain-containing protein n=1 Tax=Exophiala aquamarina CBS 119918 TaxID=1182545 RepID=A0A072PRG4_9EURO|nr:uncharacterized protein A1O9_03490 [Exophiala aquamarina CBS 119918]KEF61918.1 hypothetical protein A1O9_03490 [Exophiala aquamarina CBS 119918]
MDFDLTAFGFSSDESNMRSFLSPKSAATSLLSLDPEQEEDLDLSIPSFGTVGGFEMFPGPGTSSVAGPVTGREHVPSIFNDELNLVNDLIFDVDDNGILRPVDDPGHQIPCQGISGAGGQDLVSVGFDEMLASEHVESRERDIQQITLIDDDGPTLDDDEPLLPAVARSSLNEEKTIETGHAKHPTSSVLPIDEHPVTAEAPQQRARCVKSLRPDRYTELSNKVLHAWNENYAVNMQAARRVKQQKLSHSEARKYAALWSVGQGLGRVAFAFGNDSEPHPLAVFSGQSLWAMLQDHGSTNGTKRSRSQSERGENSGEDNRRVKARLSPHEDIARGPEDGNTMVADGDDGVVFQGDDLNIESQVGRHAPPSLQDHSSGMPWNISASRQSSVQPLGSGLMARLSSSVGGMLGGMELGPPSVLGRRGSRLTSASPLLGRGLSRLGSQDFVDPSRLTLDNDEFANLDERLGAGLDVDFELYGPSAAVTTQIAQQSQWVTATLENEARNFLGFLQEKIQERAGRDEQVSEELEETEQRRGNDSVTFSELLPPKRNSHAVAAQGLFHVLALATKGILELYQQVAFGEIEIAIAGFQEVKSSCWPGAEMEMTHRVGSMSEYGRD